LRKEWEKTSGHRSWVHSRSPPVRSRGVGSPQRSPVLCLEVRVSLSWQLTAENGQHVVLDNFRNRTEMFSVIKNHLLRSDFRRGRGFLFECVEGCAFAI